MGGGFGPSRGFGRRPYPYGAPFSPFEDDSDSDSDDEDDEFEFGGLPFGMNPFDRGPFRGGNMFTGAGPRLRGCGGGGGGGAFRGRSGRFR